MIKLTVREVAEAKGFKNACQLGEATGIPPNSIYPIWNGTVSRVDLSTLNRLCNTLKVQPGMLMLHISEDEFTPRKERGK